MNSHRWLQALLIVGAMGAGLASALLPAGASWTGLVVFGALLLVLTWKWPTLALSALLFSSSLKAGLAIPVDLTVAMAGLLLVRLIGHVAEVGWQPMPRALWAWVAFGILLSVGTLGSPAQEYGLDKSLRFLMLSGLTVVAAVQLIRDSRAALEFAWFNVFISVLVSSAAVIAGGDPRFFGRLAAFGADTIALGRASALGLTTLFVLGSWKRIPWIVAVIGIALSLWALLGSGNRASLLAVVAGVLVVVALRLQGRQRTRWRSVMVLAAVLTSAVLIWQFVPSISASRYGGLVQGLGAFYGDERYSLMVQALELWLQHPLLGAGTGAFASASPLASYPHNILMEVLCENGILGLALLMWPIIVAGVRVARRPLASSTAGQLLAAGIATSLVGALLSSDINGQRLLYALVAATLAVCLDQSTAGGSRPELEIGD